METRPVGCCECGGTGWEENSDEGMKDFIRDGYAGRNAKGMLEVYRHWKKTGNVPCWNCKGTGEVKMRLRQGA